MVEMLIKLGLTEKEAKVYLALLELGAETAQNIAQKADLNRATTYVILERLMNIGLATTREEGKKTVFAANDPQELNRYIESQQRELEGKKQYLEGTITQLMALYHTTSDKPTVRFFTGIEGIQGLAAVKPAIPAEEEIVFIVPASFFETDSPMRHIMSLDSRSADRIRFLCAAPEGRVSPSIRQQLPANGLIVADDVLPFSGMVSIYPEWGVKWYALEPSPHAMLLESPSLAQSLKALFELAWAGVVTHQSVDI